MQAHINDCLKVLAAGFVDQKGAAYGFGPDSNNQATITQEASLEKLDKFHTHLSSLRMLLGTWITNCAKQAHKDLTKQFKLCKLHLQRILFLMNPILGGIQHWTKASSNLIGVKQRNLLDNGIKEADVYALQRAQAMTKLIASLRKPYGPLNSNEEIDAFLKAHKKASEKELARMLNEKIRFRRDSIWDSLCRKITIFKGSVASLMIYK